MASPHSPPEDSCANCPALTSIQNQLYKIELHNDLSVKVTDNLTASVKELTTALQDVTGTVRPLVEEIRKIGERVDTLDSLVRVDNGAQTPLIQKVRFLEENYRDKSNKAWAIWMAIIAAIITSLFAIIVARANAAPDLKPPPAIHSHVSKQP